jgi:hypothetical protein
MSTNRTFNTHLIFLYYLRLNLLSNCCFSDIYTKITYAFMLFPTYATRFLPHSSSHSYSSNIWRLIKFSKFLFAQFWAINGPKLFLQIRKSFQIRSYVLWNVTSFLNPNISTRPSEVHLTTILEKWSFYWKDVRDKNLFILLVVWPASSANSCFQVLPFRVLVIIFLFLLVPFGCFEVTTLTGHVFSASVWVSGMDPRSAEVVKLFRDPVSK